MGHGRDKSTDYRLRPRFYHPTFGLTISTFTDSLLHFLAGFMLLDEVVAENPDCEPAVQAVQAVQGLRQHFSQEFHADNQPQH